MRVLEAAALVVVNDMAEINVDAQMIVDQGALVAAEEKMVALSNGCICCTLREDLFAALAGLAETSAGKIDHVLIESSGISEPLPVAETFTFADATGASLGRIAKLDTLVTVVDGAGFMDELHAADRLKHRGWETGDADARTVAQLFCDQVEFANVIVVNKMDLVDDEQRDRLRALLATMNPGATLVEATRGAVDPRAVLGTGLFDGAAAAAHPDWLKEARVGEHVSESAEYGISSFAFKSRRPLDPTRLLQVLHAHTRDGLECVVRPDLFPERDGPAPAGRVVRAKGLVWLAVAQNHAQGGLASLAGRYFTIELGKPWAAATADAAPLSDEATDAAALWERLWGDRRTELVVIGQGLDHDAMDAALRASEVTDDELGAFQRRLRALRLDALVADLKRASDPRAIADVLKTLAAADVTVAMLHEFQWGRVVSKLRKHGSALVSVSATTLITKWRALAAAAGVPPAPPRARKDDAAADYAAAAAAARASAPAPAPSRADAAGVLPAA